MKVLNLYAGIGGNRKLWTDCEVTAVEYNESIANVYKDNFPKDNVVIGDAHQYLLDHFDEFDFVWTSPPCPTHSQLQSMIISNTGKITYPAMELYQEIIILKKWFKGKFCVENVIPYYDPLIPPTKKLHRHFYWTNFVLSGFEVASDRKHTDIIGSSNIYGFDISKSKIKDKGKALRNMVDPELGLHIFNLARGIIIDNNKEQGKLF